MMVWRSGIERSIFKTFGETHCCPNVLTTNYTSLKVLRVQFEIFTAYQNTGVISGQNQYMDHTRAIIIDLDYDLLLNTSHIHGNSPLS